MIQWGWNYFTRNRGARLITLRDAVGQQPEEEPQVAAEPKMPVEV